MPLRHFGMRSLFVAGVVAGVSFGEDCRAQSLFGSGGNSARAGTSAIGGTSAGGTSFGGAGVGGTALGGSGLGTSALGPSGLGTTALGPTGQGGTAGSTALGGTNTIGLNTQMGQLSTTIGQGFIGRSDNAGRFVGVSSAAGPAAGGTGLAAPSFAPQFNALQGSGRDFVQPGQNQQGRFGGQNQPERIIRPQQKIAFEFDPRPQAEIRTALTSQIRRLETRRPGLDGVTVQMDGSAAVLRGDVPTEDVKKLAAALARLEPGVRSVKNEIRVRP